MRFITKHIDRICSVNTFLERSIYALRHFKIIYLFIFLISLSPINNLQSQPGNIFLKNYSPNLNNIGSKNTSITQGSNGIMYFANPSGILSYDGKSWGLINVPSIPLVLVTNPINKRIFVGCSKDFGYIEFDATGKEVYTSISEYYSNFENISKIIITKEFVYFYCAERLFCYSITSKNLSQILSPAWNEQFSGFFQNNNGVFVNIEGKGLHIIKGNKLWPVINQLAKQKIIASIPLSNFSSLIYTNDNNAYVFNGSKLEPFILEDVEYLKSNSVINGINLSENLFVLSTLSGGCVIINKKTGKTNSIINYQTGLPDNEVYAIATDNLGGLWITHNYGVTRADNQLPITSYSSYPGLKGNLTDVIKVDEKLYVATSEGVFLLSKSLTETPRLPTINSRGKVEKQVKECKIDSTLFPNPIKKDDPNSTVEESKKGTHSKNVFKKVVAVFKKKSNKPKKEEQLIEGNKPQSGQEKFTISEIKLPEPLIYNSPSLSNSYNPCSFEYSFKKINGIDKKCNQLLYHNGKLYAATITDVYEIENSTAKSIINTPHINIIYVSDNYPNCIYIGTNDGIILFFLENRKINFRDLGVNVSSIAEDTHFNLWIGGVNQVLKFEVNKKGELSRQYVYPLSANYSDYIKVRNINGGIWFFSSFDIYQYDDERDVIIKDTTLNLDLNINKILFSKNEQRIWVHKDLFWNYYTNNAKHKMVALSVINNIRHLYVDNEKNCWVINDDNILYRVTRNRIENHKNSNLFIREVRNTSGEMLPIHNVVLEHNNSSIRFVITNPFYINESANLYQYFLEGVMKDWSEWSTNKTIDFPYLPYGNFKLIVRAKNVFGYITENKGISFSVEYPYWLRWWFYLIEIGGVFLLLTLSIYYNKSENTSFLSKSLLLLSVVISFKLIQALIESNISVSPVFDFTLSVTMVFVILKVEKIIINKLTNNTRMLKTRIIWKKRKKLQGEAENKK